MRDEAVVDINQLTPSLVATTDPTASRQLHELDRALACLREEQREAILLSGSRECPMRLRHRSLAFRSEPYARACRAAAMRYAA
jgi:hypothetical protein